MRILHISILSNFFLVAQSGWDSCQKKNISDRFTENYLEFPNSVSQTLKEPEETDEWEVKKCHWQQEMNLAVPYFPLPFSYCYASFLLLVN